MKWITAVTFSLFTTALIAEEIAMPENFDELVYNYSVCLSTEYDRDNAHHKKAIKRAKKHCQSARRELIDSFPFRSRKEVIAKINMSETSQFELRRSYQEKFAKTKKERR